VVVRLRRMRLKGLGELERSRFGHGN
jgi:hypothetical protein